MNLIDSLNEQDFHCDELITGAELKERFLNDKPPVVALDTESQHFYWFKQEVNPFAVQVSWGRDNTYYVAVDDDATELEAYRAVRSIIDAAHNGETTIVMHNLKYDLHVCKRLYENAGDTSGFRVPSYPYIQDTMIMSHVLEALRSHSLKNLCDSYEISYDPETDASDLQKQIAGWRDARAEVTGEEPGFDEVPKYLMVPYAVQDAYLTYALYEQLLSEFEAQDPEERERKKADIRNIYKLEMTLLPILFKAEERGVRIDMDFCYEQIAELTPLLPDLEARCCELLGWEEFNPLSPDDLDKAMMQLGYGEHRWVNPGTGKPNWPDWKLEEIIKQNDCEVTRHIQEYRLASKLLNTYFENLVDLKQDDPDGQSIVHCNMRQTGARTGRMSVTEPALQTIPKKKGNVRGAFIAREGHQLIFADFSQQELVLLAHYTSYGSDKIRNVFLEGRDLHAETAKALYSLPEGEEPTDDQRGRAKGFNFAIVYGAGVPKLAEMLGAKDLSEGKKFLNNYHRQFPGIRWLKGKTQKQMKAKGFITTLFGRRHRENDPKFSYKAINHLIQGCAADLTKAAMIKVDQAFEREGMKATIVLAVHDEIIVEAPDEEVAKAIDILNREMIDFPQINTPLKVDISSADRWSDA